MKTENSNLNETPADAKPVLAIRCDVELLRDCWSAACAAGYHNFPSLNKMQIEFEKWLDEKGIDWRNDR